VKSVYRSFSSGTAGFQLLILAGVIMVGGCTSPKVLGPRKYIPAPMDQPAVTVEESITEDLVIPEKKDEDLKVPSKEAAAPAVDTKYPPLASIAPVPETAPEKTYTVKKNDSIWKIARQFGVSYVDLAAYNNYPINKPLYVGKVLSIPPATYHASKAERKKISSKVKSRKSKRSSSKKYSSSKTPVVATLSGGNKYIVRNGDNPWLIARRFKVKLSDLLNANNLTSKSMLKVGQTLIIPSGKVEAPATTPTIVTPEKKASSLDTVLDTVPDPTVAPDTKTPIAPSPKVDTEKIETTPIVIEDKVEKAVPAPVKKDETDSLSFGKQIEAMSDTTVENLAKKYGTTVEKLKLLNPTIPDSGKVEKGSLIQLPK